MRIGLQREGAAIKIRDFHIGNMGRVPVARRRGNGVRSYTAQNSRREAACGLVMGIIVSAKTHFPQKRKRFPKKMDDEKGRAFGFRYAGRKCTGRGGGRM